MSTSQPSGTERRYLPEVPDARDQSELFGINEHARRALFEDARSANAFTDEPVTDAQLEAIFSLSQWPPTQANMNPLRWLVIRTPQAKRRLDRYLADGNKAKTFSSPATVVLAADVDFHEQYPQLFPARPHLRNVFAENPARETIARNNAWLQAGYFILAVRAVGLAAGPMVGADFVGVDEEFFSESSWRTLLICNIGRPAAEGAWFDRLPRLSFAQVVQEACRG